MRSLGTRRHGAVAAPSATVVADVLDDSGEEPSKAPKPPSVRRLIIALCVAAIALFFLLHGEPSSMQMTRREPVQSSASAEHVAVASIPSHTTSTREQQPASAPRAQREPWLPTPAQSSEIAAAQRAHTALGLRSLGAAPGDAFLLSVRPTTGCALTGDCRPERAAPLTALSP